MKQSQKNYTNLISELEKLYKEAVALEEKFNEELRRVHPRFRKSARNLLHYLALRQHDIRELQEALMVLGLSSLGRAEGHVLASLHAVLNQLCHLAGCPPFEEQPEVSFFENRKLLTQHTESLLGPLPEERTTRIMVTLSSDLAKDYQLVVRMLKAGMDCARINCAHDTPEVWLAMIRNIRKAEKETGTSCAVLCDLMGPKLRTGDLQTGPKVMAIRPVNNEIGLVASPAIVWIAAPNTPAPGKVDATLPVDGIWAAQLQEGDSIRFKDTRGRKRTLSVVRKEKKGVIAHLLKTSYVATGTILTVENETIAESKTIVGELPSTELPILLKKDHLLILHRDPIPGEPAVFDANGHILKPAHISCTLPEVFDQVKKGEPILFDDGAIEGIVEEVRPGELLVKITFAKE
ncbi:MAG TPA: pyruvate kinase, partial [Pontibacter sp.]